MTLQAVSKFFGHSRYAIVKTKDDKMKRRLLIFILFATISVLTPLSVGSGAVAYAASTTGATTTAPSGPTCIKTGFDLNWMLCSIFNGVSKASDGILEKLIEPALKTQPICLDVSGGSCEDGKNYLFTIWSSFRIYGDVFLVIALLVIVFGESIGGGVIDAYAAKKILPRLLLAAVLINTSIYIVALMVDVTNIVGGAIGQVITAPLADNGFFSIQPSGVQSKSIAMGGLLATGLGVSSITALVSTEGASMLLLTLAIPAFLAFLAILVTVVLRQAVIFALIIAAPIAFAMYCLPNTEKYFKKWWNLLFQMLIIYPIIILIFAVADVLSVITGNIGNNNPVNAVLSFMLLIIPLFLIPYSFKLAGGALSQLHDVANNGSKRVSGMAQDRKDRAKAKYANKVVSRRAGTYGAFNSGKGVRGGVGKLIKKTPKANYAFGRRLETVGQQVSMHGAELAKDPRAATIQHDDDALRATTYRGYDDAVSGLTARNISKGMTATDAKAQAQRASRAAQTSVGFGSAQATWAAQAMAQSGTAYDDLEDVATTIARAGGNNTSTIAGLAGNINSVTKSSGRHDLAPSFNNLNNLALGEAGIGGGKTTGNYSAAKTEAWKSASLYQHANDKPQNIDAAIKHFTPMLSSSNKDEQEDAAVFFHELKQMQPSAIGKVNESINNALDDPRTAAAIASAKASLGATPASPQTVKTNVDNIEDYVPDPSTGGYTKVTTPVESQRRETAAERIDRKSRAYERPNPDRM